MIYRKDIQGLRAVAFLLVFLFHLHEPLLPGGYIGVDLFFVISGYLISSIIQHEILENKFKLYEFYEKRVKRIVPTYYFVLIVISFLGILFFLNSELLALRKGLQYCFLFIYNLYKTGGNDYFGATMDINPLLHTWTLAIEMQFYLILPILFLLLKKQYLTYTVISLIILLSIYSSYNLHNGLKAEMYLSLLARIPEFLIGTLCALKYNFLKKILNRTIYSYVGLVIIIICAILYSEHSLFPGYLALYPCLGAVLLICGKESLITKFLSSRIMINIGEWSYSLYLWHWPIMTFWRYRFDKKYFNTLDIFFITVLTFLLSYLTYKFIESKWRKLYLKKFNYRFIPLSILMVLLALNLHKLSIKKDIPKQFENSLFGIHSHGTYKSQSLGDTVTNEYNIAFIGNSHALTLKPFIHFIGINNNIKFNSISTSQIPPIPGIKTLYGEYKIENLETALNHVHLVEKMVDTSDALILSMPNETLYEILDIKEIISYLKK